MKRPGRAFAAVLFDLDGTLLNTIQDISLAMNRILSRHGFPLHTEEEYKMIVGEGIEETVRRSLPRGSGDGLDLEEVIRDYRREYDLTWRMHSRPYHGIPELLGQLRRRGLELAILSNKSHSFTTVMATELLPFEFDVVRGATPGIPIKPDPAGALAIARELGLPAESFVFVGDMSVDMLTARAAGMTAAGALWGFRSAEELRQAGADVLLSSPGDLIGLIATSKGEK